ncbi:MAG: hypothetical protein BWY77_01138 [bacterium ADurb.Bin431]|nr:MAG: hypothetical protein BWY77_01138 [bacterium ADurb.Bin431]
MPAGAAAARASGEYQVRKTRSMKVCTVQAPVLKIRGRAMSITAR